MVLLFSTERLIKLAQWLEEAEVTKSPRSENMEFEDAVQQKNGTVTRARAEKKGKCTGRYRRD